MKKFLKILIAVILLFVVWNVIASLLSPDHRAADEMRSQGINVSRVWTGKLTSGNNFAYIYTDELNAATANAVLNYVNQKPDYANASLEITQPIKDTNETFKDYKITGIVDQTTYTKDMGNFFTLLDGYRNSLLGAHFDSNGFYASVVTDEKGNRLQGQWEMHFVFSKNTPRETVTQFMQTLWAIGNAHTRTIVDYGEDTYGQSDWDGQQNNRILSPAELEAYKQDILQRIQKH